MTVSGSGVGGNIGGPQQPLQREIETTAWTEVNKASLAIVPDTLEVPFTNLGGYLWKYESTASRPTLKPLESLRISQGESSEDNNEWKLIYDQLTEELPPDVKAALLEDSTKSFNDRNPVLVNLSYLMQSVSKYQNWLQQTANKTSSESPFMAEGSSLATRIKENQEMGTGSLKTSLNQGGLIYSQLASYLKSVGPNDPNFDKLLGFTKELGNIYNTLSGISDTNIQNAANNISKISQEHAQSNTGDNLQILGQIFKSLAVIGGSLSSKNGAPSLFFGLEAATIGIKTADSKAGVLGDSLNSLLNDLAQSALETVKSNTNAGEQRYFEALTKLSALAISGSASLIAEKGLGRLPNAGNAADENQNRLYGLEIALSYIANSHLMAHVFETFAAASGVSEKNQETIGTVMETCGLLLALFSGARGNEKDANSLMLSIKEPLTKNLEKLNEIISKDQQDGKVNGDISQGLSIYIQQGLLALNEENYQEFYAAFEGTLKLMNISPENFSKDLDTLKNTARTLVEQVNSSTNDKTNTLTGIANFA